MNSQYFSLDSIFNKLRYHRLAIVFFTTYLIFIYLQRVPFYIELDYLNHDRLIYNNSIGYIIYIYYHKCKIIPYLT